MPGWVDLHVHSNYSFLDGASDVDDLADAAVEQGLDALARLGAVFGERLYVELSDHLDPDDPAFCDTLAQLASEMGLGCVVTNNVHYARPEGRRLHDVLRCIDLGTTLDEAGNRLKPNGEYWLKGEAMLRERLGRFDEAFRHAREIADACVLDLLYDTNTPRAEAP